MWWIHSVELNERRGQRWTVTRDEKPSPFVEVLRAWQEDAGFRDLFNAALANTPYKAFRWETPGVTSATINRPFECVVLDSPGLTRPPEPEAFAEHFHEPGTDVVAFANLGRNAVLIVPSPIADPEAYVHLASFTRLAPEPQRHSLWRMVGDQMVRRISDQPVWLSTAGAGVAWLHVRLDDTPKYYGYGPYKQA